MQMECFRSFLHSLPPFHTLLFFLLSRLPDIIPPISLPPSVSPSSISLSLSIHPSFLSSLFLFLSSFSLSQESFRCLEQTGRSSTSSLTSIAWNGERCGCRRTISITKSTEEISPILAYLLTPGALLSFAFLFIHLHYHLKYSIVCFVCACLYVCACDYIWRGCGCAVVMAKLIRLPSTLLVMASLTSSFQMPTRKRFGPAPPLPFRKLELSPSRLPLFPICSANEFPILHRQSCKRWGWWTPWLSYFLRNAATSKAMSLNCPGPPTRAGTNDWCSTLSYESPGSIGGVGKARGHEAFGFLGEEHWFHKVHHSSKSVWWCAKREIKKLLTLLSTTPSRASGVLSRVRSFLVPGIRSPACPIYCSQRQMTLRSGGTGKREAEKFNQGFLTSQYSCTCYTQPFPSLELNIYLPTYLIHSHTTAFPQHCEPVSILYTGTWKDMKGYLLKTCWVFSRDLMLGVNNECSWSTTQKIGCFWPLCITSTGVERLQ